MVVTTEEQFGARIAKISTRIDHASSEQFSKELQPLLTQCNSSSLPLILDFSGVEYISSVGLRVLMMAARQVKAQQGKIAIASLAPVVEEVFIITRFNLVLSVYPTVEAAAEGLLK